MSSATLAPPAEAVTFWEIADAFDEDEVPRPLERLEAEHTHVDERVRDTFSRLADELIDATAGMSSTRRAVRHPAFLEILALGNDAIPLLVERVSEPGNRPIWLRLLGVLTAFQPGAGAETIDEAARRWVAWNKSRGLGR